jgi:choice-of-anchor A domain-containing protein
LLTPQLLTLTVTSPDGSTSRTVQAMTGALPPAVDIGQPLAYAQSPFAIVSLGDTAMNGNFHVWGGAAIGGNLRFNGGAEVGHNNGGVFVVPGEAPHVTALLVNGAIDFANSTGSITVLSGWTHVGSLPANSTSVSGNIVTLRPPGAPSSVAINGNGDSQSAAAGNIVWPNLFDFAGAFDAFRKTSTALGHLPGQCVDAVAARFVSAQDEPLTSGNAFWSITPGKVNVLTTTIGQLNSMGNINTGGANATYDTPLIINITDANVVLTKGDITQNWPQHVIWNFPNATSVNVTGLLGGSLYAPFADITINGEVRGAVIGKSLSGGNEVKWNNFQPNIRDIDCEREP